MESNAGTDEILTRQDGHVLTVTFNRPQQRNAMTWTMYEGLRAACERANTDDSVRVMVLTGAGEKAFVAGTDIGQFQEFTSGQDGVEYEHTIGAISETLEAVRVPTVAAVRGYCVGGGLILAAVCDLRVATRSARFGVPVARTLGNCLSMNTYSLLVHHMGPSRTLDMLLRARLFDADEAAAAGFVAEVCADEDLEDVVRTTTSRLLEHAPLSMWAAKEAVRRLRLANLPDGDDIVARVFGSDDFHRGVAAFMAKERPDWQGN
ncbi:enoyl-CoA hydratase/isomerase family protein [Spiractinospora alimapuensis]|nr:enoyl-CoA hydratase/isomerase family protein [Spiractinospora alimapuensis]